jgi:hypothetical protein
LQDLVYYSLSVSDTSAAVNAVMEMCFLDYQFCTTWQHITTSGHIHRFTRLKQPYTSSKEQMNVQEMKHFEVVVNAISFAARRVGN